MDPEPNSTPKAAHWWWLPKSETTYLITFSFLNTLHCPTPIMNHSYKSLTLRPVMTRTTKFKLVLTKSNPRTKLYFVS